MNSKKKNREYGGGEREVIFIVKSILIYILSPDRTFKFCFQNLDYIFYNPLLVSLFSLTLQNCNLFYLILYDLLNWKNSLMTVFD